MLRFTPKLTLHILKKQVANTDVKIFRVIITEKSSRFFLKTVMNSQSPYLVLS